MSFFYANTRLTIVLVSLSLVLLPLPELILNTISLILIGTVGLMHGATDHVLDRYSVKSETSQWKIRQFLFKYLSILAIMAAIWLALPAIALIFFILVSGYHFGQTQLQYLGLSESKRLKKMLYFFWGIGIIGIIVFFNADESRALIESITTSEQILGLFKWELELKFLAILFSALAIIWSFPYSTKKTVFVEFFEILVIVIYSQYLSLLVSFALFFGLWHSLRASQVQIDKLNSIIAFRPMDFVRNSLPFTLISLLGILVLLFASQQFKSSIASEMLFLIAISMLTMPHMFIYEKFYNRFDVIRKK